METNDKIRKFSPLVKLKISSSGVLNNHPHSYHLGRFQIIHCYTVFLHLHFGFQLPNNVRKREIQEKETPKNTNKETNNDTSASEL